MATLCFRSIYVAVAANRIQSILTVSKQKVFLKGISGECVVSLYGKFSVLQPKTGNNIGWFLYFADQNVAINIDKICFTFTKFRKLIKVLIVTLLFTFHTHTHT